MIKTMKDLENFFKTEDVFTVLPYLNWDKFLLEEKLSENLLSGLLFFIGANKLCSLKKLSDDFIDLHFEEFDLEILCEHQCLNMNILSKHKELIQHSYQIECIIKNLVVGEYDYQLLDFLNVFNISKETIEKLFCNPNFALFKFHKKKYLDFIKILIQDNYITKEMIEKYYDQLTEQAIDIIQKQINESEEK